MGWRWQSPLNEEAMTALKGLAYLKREILRVQDQVLILEDKIQTTQQIQHKESALRAIEHSEVKHSEVEHSEIDHKEIEHREKCRLYSSETKEYSEMLGGGGVEAKRNILPKYQEVLELAAKGQPIAEIAQHLSLSQDAVTMVLQTQSKGAAR